MTGPKKIPANNNFEPARELHSAELDALLNDLEKTSLSALIAFIAYKQSVSEELIKAYIVERFGCPANKIKQADYENVMKYLCDLEVKKGLQ